MITRVFVFLLGFGLMIVGFTYMITYLNLLTLGYDWTDYFLFISCRVECLFTLLGFLLLNFAIFWKGGEKDDLHI